MENKKNNELTITNFNLHLYNPRSYIKRKTSDIADMLLKDGSTIFALQEFGSRSFSGDINGKELQKILESNGYLMIAPLLEGKHPVNTRIFYKASKATLIKELPPIFQKAYTNRQCGGVFQIGDKIVNIFSLHLPLFSNDQIGKKEFWSYIIDYAKNNKDENVIFAGDFNESRLQQNPTSLAKQINELEKYFTEASGQEPTWNEKKLDHIFVSPSLVNTMTIHPPIENTISDHKGLHAKFLL